MRSFLKETDAISVTGQAARTQPGIFSVDDLADAGTDDGTAVTNYGGPAHFSGHLEKVKIETHRGGVTSQADGKKEGEMKKTE